MRLLFILKRFLSEAFLRLCLTYVKFHLKGRNPKRSFERVCIVAALNHCNGIVRGASLQYECFLRLGIDVEILDASEAHHNPFFRIKHKPATAYIFHCAGPQIATLLAAVLPAARNAYRIAYWAWELPGPPKEWPAAEPLISEIWTCSQFSRSGLAQRYTVPVHVCHHVVAPRAASEAPRQFTVLVLADSRSSFVRKNPIAAVQAFHLAFGNSPAVRLIVKINGSAVELRNQLEKFSLTNVEVADRFLTDESMIELFQSVSVVLSLHRAEGFGLPILEAMALGIPVIATNWSGNMDFMNEQNSLLIHSRQIPVDDKKLYSRYADLTWAEPNVEEAAKALRLLHADSELYDRVARRGRETADLLLHSWQIPIVDTCVASEAHAANYSAEPNDPKEFVAQ